jgi:predicted N-acyltransferase
VNDDDIVIEAAPGIAAVDAAEWDALLALQAAPTPFMRHAYLHALEASGSATPETGWKPLVLTVRRHGALLAAAIAYLKTHSYGEYVFDWAWADAYRRYGRRYYPKLLLAVPFTPVPGSRLLARDAAAREQLARAAMALARQVKCSSVHLLFGDDADFEAAAAAGAMRRHGVQFHWHNREPQPYADFEDFLAGLQHDKRKKIRQERRRVAEAGVVFETKAGPAITPDDWDFFFRCYESTYEAHQSTPYLSRDFFARMAAEMPEAWTLFLARRDGAPIACSLIAVDAAGGVAFGRYWGAIAYVPQLHFEACYYQPLAWCIAQGLRRFEGGAQGEHKMARGLMPVRTGSAHWIADEDFAGAIREHLAAEGESIDEYLDELDDRTPFRR